MSTNPIAGNQNFTKVETLAGPLSELNVSDARASSLHASSVTTDSMTTNSGAYRLVESTVYAPTSFSTLAINGVVFFNSARGLAAATAVTDSQLFLLPANAQILSATLTNNGTTVAGGTTYDVGTEVWSAAPTGTSNVAAAVPLATLNTGTTVSSTANAFGSAGANTGLVIAAANTGLSVQVLTTANTAGDMAVTLRYLLPV